MFYAVRRTHFVARVAAGPGVWGPLQLLGRQTCVASFASSTVLRDLFQATDRRYTLVSITSDAQFQAILQPAARHCRMADVFTTTNVRVDNGRGERATSGDDVLAPIRPADRWGHVAGVSGTAYTRR